MTSAMEELCESLFLDQVPESWTARAYASAYGLTAWYADLLLRMKELETWVGDFQVGASSFMSGYFLQVFLLVKPNLYFVFCLHFLSDFVIND